MDERNNLDENVLNVISALNTLLVSSEISKDNKAMLKINRFKNWLNDFYENYNK